MALTADQVASEIQNTMSFARSEANVAINSAMTLVATATGILTQYTPDYPSEPVTSSESGVSYPPGTFIPEEKPATFPTIRTPQEIQMGALGDLSTIDLTFDEEAPTLDLPAFSYSTPAPLTPFAKTAPDVDDSIDIPDSPTFDYPDLPTLLDLRTDIELDQLVVPAHNFTPPSYNNFLSDDFYSAFATGRSELPSYDQYGMELINRFYPGVQAALQQLIDRATGVLGGSQTALTEAHDSRYYDALRAKIALETAKAEQALDQETTAAGWSLPGAARIAGARRIQQEGSRALSNAALEVYVKRADRELQHLQFIMQVVPALQSAAVALFGQAWSMQMQAFDAALRFGDTAMKFATAVYALKQRDFELEQGLLESQIRIFEALLKAELAKAEITKAELEVEKLKSDLNGDLITRYTAQLQGQETKAKVFAAQIDALRLTIEARKLPLDVFDSEIKAFSALATAKRDEYAILEAQISGDEAKTRGQLAKVDVYKTQADVFGTRVSAQAKKIEGQSQRNQQILEEFRTRVQAEVQYSQIDGEIARNALDAYKAQAQVFLSETEANLSEAKFDFQKKVEDARLEMESTRLAFERQFRALELEMTRVKATADITMGGADVHARIGQSAISTMNTMANLSASTTS